MDIDQARVLGPMSTDQLLQYYQGALSSGARVVRDRRDTNSYYMVAKVQFSAAQGEYYVRVDRELAEAILRALGTGGQLSEAEIERQILAKITDAGRYTDAEAILTRLLLAATDDRKTVKLNGEKINMSDAAERALEKGLRAFWASLGAKARWGQRDPAGRYMP